MPQQAGFSRGLQPTNREIHIVRAWSFNDNPPIGGAIAEIGCRTCPAAHFIPRRITPKSRVVFIDDLDTILDSNCIQHGFRIGTQITFEVGATASPSGVAKRVPVAAGQAVAVVGHLNFDPILLQPFINIAKWNCKYRSILSGHIFSYL